MSGYAKENFDIIIGSPTDFTSFELTAFIRLVCCGGEVGNQDLGRNVAKAKKLIFLKQNGQNIGVAALKCPLESYRNRIAGCAGTEIPVTEFPFELGYIFIVQAARRQGFSGQLVNKALTLVPKAGVFATARVDNYAMRKTLCNAGFEPAGAAYCGREGRPLQIFVRPAVNAHNSVA